MFEATFTVKVTRVPRDIALGPTVAVPVHGAPGTVVVVVVGGTVVVVVVVGGTVVVVVVVVGGTVVVVVVGGTVVVVVVVVVVTGVFTTNEAAALFQRNIDVHPGAKTPTMTVWLSSASPAGTVHVDVNVRVVLAVNAWLSHTW